MGCDAERNANRTADGRMGGVDGLNDVLAEYVSGNQTASYVIGTGLEAMISNSGTQSFYHFDVTATQLR